MEEVASKIKKNRKMERIINSNTSVCKYGEYKEIQDKILEREKQEEFEICQPQDIPKKHVDLDTCCICVDEFDKEDRIRITVCDHIFHDRCLVQWLEHKLKKEEPPDCPNCRKGLGKE